MLVRVEPTPIEASDDGAPRHLQSGFARSLPIGFFGFGLVGEALTDRLAIYRDLNGLPRCFDPAGHDATAIASLFAGDIGLLSRLWPSRRRRWNPTRARQTLLTHQARFQTTNLATRFVPTSESAAAKRAHLASSRLASRLLWRGTDPYVVLDLARGWNRTRGNSVLSDEIVVRIVNAACGRELSRQEQRHAG
ncbi:MAG TPA: hypothetical protein VFF43_16945 [Caldimonas sp.]|nr:hypothetical protein [Caldimonas sp.]